MFNYKNRSLVLSCLLVPLLAFSAGTAQFEEITNNAFSVGISVRVEPHAPPAIIAGMVLHKASGWYDGVRLELFATADGFVPALEIGRPEGAWKLKAPQKVCLPPSVWRHLAATWDGSTARLYVGGKLVASGLYSGTWTPAKYAGSGGVGMGREAYGLLGFPMKVKDAFLWNRVLTPNEIQALAGVQEPADDAVLHEQRRLFRSQQGLFYNPSAEDFVIARSNWLARTTQPYGPAPSLPEANLPLSPTGVTFYVSPNGKDKATGTKEDPFATLRQAQLAIRNLRKDKGKGMPKGGIKVVVSQGIYPVTETLAFTAEDSGTEDCPILWCAAPNAKPVLDGGFRVRDFRSITEVAVKSRLTPQAISAIRVADVRKQRYTHFEPLPQIGMEVGENGGELPVVDLYCDGVRQNLARHPNEGWWKIFGGDSKTSVVSIDKVAEIATRFAQDKELYYVGYPRYLWADWTAPIVKIDATTGTITLPPRPNGRRIEKFVSNHPYYLMNALSALDQEGEWFLDRSSGLLYVWDPRGEVVLSDFAKPFVTFDEVSHFEWRGISMRYGRGTAVVANRCSHWTLADCAIGRFGNGGIYLNNAQNVTLRNNELTYFGHGAIRATGGDRVKLIPAGIVIENNEIAFVEQWKHTYAPGLLLEGCGAHIRWNHFHDMRSSAMRLEGNDFLVASNLVEDVVLESDDQGGIDIYANPTYAIRIVHNIWRRIGRGGDFIPCGQAGVRFDDAVSNMIVYGNRFEQCGYGYFGAIQTNGGRNNTIENNMFVGCQFGASIGAWGQDRWEKFVNRPEWVQLMTNEPYASRYPGITGLVKMPVINRMWRNVVIGDAGLYRTQVKTTDVRANFAFDSVPETETGRQSVEAVLIKEKLWEPLPPLSAIGRRRGK